MEHLALHKSGIRFVDLVRAISAESPETSYNTIYTQVAEMPGRFPSTVIRPFRGLFVLAENYEGRFAGESPAPERSLPNTVENLRKLGFTHVGLWETYLDGIRHVIHVHADQERILYAFTTDDDVMYIGKSRRSLSKRMDHYQKVATSQVTVIKNNRHIRAALEAGKTAHIYALVHWKQYDHHGIPINVAAGIEDELIERMRPPWND